MKLRRDIVTFLHVAAQRYLKKYYKFLLRNVYFYTNLFPYASYNTFKIPVSLRKKDIFITQSEFIIRFL